MNFALVNIFYLKNASFGVDNVKTINSTNPNYGQEVFISVTATPENTKSFDYILRNYLTLTLISFCTSIFCKNRVLNFSKLCISIYVFAKLQRIQLILIYKPVRNLSFNSQNQ